MKRNKVIKKTLLISVLYIAIMAPVDYFLLEKSGITLTRFVIKILIQFIVFFIAMLIGSYYINDSGNNKSK